MLDAIENYDDGIYYRPVLPTRSLSLEGTWNKSRSVPFANTKMESIVECILIMRPRPQYDRSVKEPRTN